MGSRQQLAKVKVTGVTVCCTMTSPSARVPDRGVVFDTEMTVVDHVNSFQSSWPPDKDDP